MATNMARGASLATLLLLTCSIYGSWSVSFSVFVSQDEAHQVLKVRKRANQFLEEIHSGNLERECFEETCSFEEAKEIFKSQEKTTEFWFHYKGLNPCKENPCKNGGLCKLKHYDYLCICPPLFQGKLCETEKLECWYKNGGCWQYCQDAALPLGVVCSCAQGYALGEDGKSCLQSARYPCGLIQKSTQAAQEVASRPSGRVEQEAPKLNGKVKRGAPRSNRTAEEGTRRLNESAEEGTPRSNRTTEGSTPRLNGSIEVGTPRFNESAEAGTPRSNRTTEGSTPRLNGSIEVGTPRFNESAEAGTPRSNRTEEGGTRRLNGSVEVGTPTFNGTAEGGTPRLNGSIEAGTPRFNGTAEEGTPRLTESAEEDIPGINGTAKGGAPTLSEWVAGGTPRLSGSAEGGTSGLSESAKEQNVHDGLTQTDAEGNLTGGDLPSWTRVFQTAEPSDTRVTGGSFCHRGSCPWQVFIQTSRGYGVCGGSLISSRWVVTAAHCLDIVRPHHVTVGDFDKHQREVKEQKLEVQQSWVHPHYDSDNYNGDIALLYLSSDVVFNEYVLPICLPSPNLATLLTAEGTKGMVSGWGSTHARGPGTRFLMKVKLPIVSMETCRQSTAKLITDNMFCAGYADKAQDACKGDSGGPFAVSYRDTWYLLGIVSWGEGCAEAGKYGAYTRVANYVPWIKEVFENVAEAGGFLPSR
ncbi:coagulation factor X-like [Pelodiscus sinensis]|uniref:coagulation factor X-like n=1 Tax=Pelodiscus sinensis TaxID=13735 RepID=UPI003F6B34AD